MNGLAVAFFLIPVADQALKLLLRQRLGPRSIPLGPMGAVRIVESRIWLSRVGNLRKPMLFWSLWFISAITLALLSRIVPASGWCAGLLLGGSLSHLLETTLRGRVTDYVCLRFWPAFNLADVAITLGVMGVVACAFLFFTHTGS